MTTKTQRLINRIEEKESFNDVAYVCEDFDTFIEEIAEWGVDHIAGVDFDDPEVNRGMKTQWEQSQSRSRNLLRTTLWGYGGLMLKNVFYTNQY